MPKTTYANQRHVRIEQLPRSKDNVYAMMNVDALNEAMKNLKHAELRLWLYLNKNQNHYELDLSPAAVRKACGLPESSYHRAFEGLICAGYLVPDSNGTNTYVFYEAPQ